MPNGAYFHLKNSLFGACPCTPGHPWIVPNMVFWGGHFTCEKSYILDPLFQPLEGGLGRVHFGTPFGGSGWTCSKPGIFAHINGHIWVVWIPPERVIFGVPFWVGTALRIQNRPILTPKLTPIWRSGQEGYIPVFGPLLTTLGWRAHLPPDFIGVLSL